MTRKFTINDIIQTIVPVDDNWRKKAELRTSKLCLPPRALGMLHNIAEQLCGIQQTLKPSVDSKAVLVMAGDHGVVAEGVSAFPQEVTGAMVQTFLGGGAGINAVCHGIGAEVWVVDMGIIPEIEPGSVRGGDRLIIEKTAKGTRNFTKGSAMTREEAEKAIMAGFIQATTLFENGIKILGTGDMGIGNTTPSAAIGAVITGVSLEEMVGPGTGVDSEGIRRKQNVIKKGIELNQPDPDNGLDVLAKLGGFEIAGITGCILAGAYHKKPVVVDGFISTAGALIAYSLCPKIIDYLFAGHCSEEPGHKHMLSHLGLKPILNLGMRLGEGTGAALAMGIIDCAVNVFTRVMTFEEAGIG